MNTKVKGELEIDANRGDVPSAQDIRSLRNRLYLTRAQFAELIGCSRSSIVNWELGRSRPREDYAQTIAEILQFQTGRQVTSTYLTICLTHEGGLSE